MPDRPTRPPLAEPSTYPHWVDEVVRFSDQNAEGHINSVAIATYIESARVAWARDLKAATGARAMLTLARLAIDYRAEAGYPGGVRIGTRLAGLGRTSLTLAHGVFKDGTCLATAGAVLVQVRAGASASIGGELRAALERMLTGAPTG